MGLRDKAVSARISGRAKSIIDNSKYSYGDAIEYFAFNVLNKNENEKQRLKHLKIKERQLKAEMNATETEIDLICKELKINPNDDLLFAEEIKKNVIAVIRWFNKAKSTYKTIENFMELRREKMKPYAEESGMEYDEFSERVISEYYSRQKEKSKK